MYPYYPQGLQAPGTFSQMGLRQPLHDRQRLGRCLRAEGKATHDDNENKTVPVETSATRRVHLLLLLFRGARHDEYLARGWYSSYRLVALPNQNHPLGSGFGLLLSLCVNSVLASNSHLFYVLDEQNLPPGFSSTPP